MRQKSIKEMLMDSIQAAARSCVTGSKPIRTKKLSIPALICFLIGAAGGSLAKELLDAGIDATPAAVSPRRRQISPDVFKAVFDNFNRECAGSGMDSDTYKGYRLLAVDGTSVNLPRDPSSPNYVFNDSTPKGYNQAHLNTIFDLCSQTYYDAVIQPEPSKDEIGALVEMLKRNHFSTPSLIIADRGYEAYNLLAHLIEKPNVDFLIRVKQNQSAMREIAKLPMCELDCNIRFTITTTQTNEDKRKQYIYLQVPKKSKPGSKTRRARWDFPSPYPMQLRIVRFMLDSGEFETVVTSLPASFGTEEIKALYHQRWGIELGYRDLKYTTGLTNLHGKRDAFAEQEIWAAMTFFNFTSRMSRQAVVRQPESGIYAYQVNFKMATAICCKYFREKNFTEEKALELISKYTVPVRPGRRDERNLRPKGFVGFVYRVAA